MESVDDPPAEGTQRRLLVHLAQADGALNCGQGTLTSALIGSAKAIAGDGAVIGMFLSPKVPALQCAGQAAFVVSHKAALR